MNNNSILVDAFKWLFIGLLTCFGASYLTTQVESIWEIIYSGSFVTISLIAELIIILVLSWGIKKISPIVAKILYLIFTALTGCCISWVFLAYTSTSITFIFLATGVIFGVFALVGKYSRIDLSKWSVYLFFALIAIIVLEIINIFLLNSTLNIWLCIISIIIFAGYIAYDVRFALEKAIH